MAVEFILLYCWMENIVALIIKCFLPGTQPFWKRPEGVINKVETRSQLQKKKVFFENIKS